MKVLSIYFLSEVIICKKYNTKALCSGRFGFQRPDEILALKELIIFGLSESEVISKNIVDKKVHFSDPLSHMLDDLDEE